MYLRLVPFDSVVVVRFAIKSTSTRQGDLKALSTDKLALVKFKRKVSFFQSSRGEIDEKPNDFRSALAGAEAKKKAFVRRINKAVASQVLTDKCSLTLIAGLEGYRGNLN